MKTLSRHLAPLGLVGCALAATGCGGAGTTGETIGANGEAITTVYGVDYSWYRPSPATLKADGYKFVARYLSHDTTGKNLSASEANALKAKGLDIVCNWEDSATDSLSGYAKGVSDATAAKAQAAADGAPSTRPIYFSVDFDADSSQAATIEKYFEGVASVIGLARTGAYGGYYIVNHLFDAGKIKWAWQTYAWSDGKWDARAQLRQIENGIDGGEMDKDEAVTADFGQWGPNAPTSAPPPPPVPRGYLDTATCTTVGGWTEEASAPSKTLSAEIYFNGAAGAAGVTAFKLTAGISRPDLCTAIGSCDHGFSMATPRGILDGEAHKVYAYGLNPTAGGANKLLSDAPKTITCAAPAIAEGDVKRHVTNPTILTDWRFDTFVDEAHYTAAAIAAVPTGVDFGAPPDVVKVAGDPAVYVVDGSFHRHIVNPASLAAWRLTSADIKPITAADLAALTAGPDWPATPLLVKDPSDPAVYLLDVPFPAPVVVDAGAPDTGAADVGAPDAAVADASVTVDSGEAPDASDGGTAPVAIDGGALLLDDSGAPDAGSVLDGSPEEPDAAGNDNHEHGKKDAARDDEDAGASDDDAAEGTRVGSNGGCSAAPGAASANLQALGLALVAFAFATKRRRR